jgi:hypothetical protein
MNGLALALTPCKDPCLRLPSLSELIACMGGRRGRARPGSHPAILRAESDLPAQARRFQPGQSLRPETVYRSYGAGSCALGDCSGVNMKALPCATG